jgi:hypothetical protein
MLTEAQKESQRLYRLNNPEKVKEKERRRWRENKEYESKRNRNYYQENKEIQRVKHRNNRHKITQEWFDAKLAEQDNRCAVCRDVFTKTPHIDHNHEHCPPLKSCEVCRRDLLCTDCNLGIGRFHDSVERLEKAIEYLRKHNGRAS